MARHQDAAALLTQPVEQLHHGQSLAGVETGERLVQHDDLRVVDQGVGHLGPLTHAFAVGDDRTGIVGVELDEMQHATAGLIGIGYAMQVGGEAYEPQPGE